MASRSYYYSLFWRWHFYAGLIVAPIVLILAVTGGLYLFQPQIEDWLYHDRLYLSAPYQGAVDHNLVVETARDAFAATRMHSYTPPQVENRSAQAVLTTEAGDKLTIFLHPGTHAILGTVDENWRLMNVAREIHKGLLLGTPGRVVTELAACWVIVMIITGLYLWWPRQRPDRGIALPNIQVKGRNLWREFHAVPGAWVSLWALALLLTGLPWSIVWGDLFDAAAQKAGEGFPKAVFEARPSSVSESGKADISVNRLIAIAAEQGIHQGFKIDFPWSENGSYALLPLRQAHDSDQVAYLFLDRRDGRVLEEYRWGDLGKIGRLTALGVAFHEGRLFGSANQWLNLAAVLLLITLCITGPVMWWKRKPKGSLGAPQVSGRAPLPRPLMGAIVALGIVLPLFGASVLVIWLGESFVAKLRSRHVAG